MIKGRNVLMMELISNESREGANPSMAEHTEWNDNTSTGNRSYAVVEMLRYKFRGLKGNSRC